MMTSRSPFRLLLTAVVACSISLLAVSFAAAQEESAPLDASLQEAITANGSKLINAGGVTAPLSTGSTTYVIVLLGEPAGRAAATDWNSPASLEVLHASTAQQIDAAVTQLPADTTTVYYRYQNFAGFAADIDQKGLTILLNDPAVQSIEPVVTLEPNLAQGIPLMNAAGVRAAYSGQGIAIAICDTGIDYNHPLLGGGGFPNSKVIGGTDTGDNDANPIPNTQNHGTACAGIAAGDFSFYGDYIGGVANNAKLYAVKISSGTTGSASDAAMVAGWDWCVTHKNDNPSFPIMVISTSFGGGRFLSTCNSESAGMTAAANNAVAAGITVLASSGNDGYCNSMGWPACISSVISVGAVYDADFGTYTPCVNANSCANKISTTGCTTGWYVSDVTAADKVTAYSNAASFLTILAPSNRAHTLGLDGSYNTSFGGTSAACPYAAGAVACLQSAAMANLGRFLTVAEVRDTLVNTGDLIADTKVAITKPRVNLGEAVASLGIVTPTPPPTPTPLPPPTNDACADAIAVCPGNTYISDTTLTTRDGTSSCGTSNTTRDIWYKYSPFASGSAVFSLCGSSYDAVMSIHTDCPGSPSNQLACNDDSTGPGCNGSLSSEITLSVSAGTTYYVRVTGYNGAFGLSRFAISGPVCPPTTLTATPTPTLPPTVTPTASPSLTPTPSPTDSPSPLPTDSPSPVPTDSPSPVPTDSPSPVPTDSPSPVPTDSPSPTPAETDSPTPLPTDSPSPVPTNSPTPLPTDSPSPIPTDSPTPLPTDSPSPTPTESETPSPTPTETDTPSPTETPTPNPTDTDTPSPTDTATPTPTDSPTPSPTPDCGRKYGDFNSDGFTDLNDFLFVLDWWTQLSPIGPPEIGLDDFLALLDYWNTSHPC